MHTIVVNKRLVLLHEPLRFFLEQEREGKMFFGPDQYQLYLAAYAFVQQMNEDPYDGLSQKPAEQKRKRGLWR